MSRRETSFHDFNHTVQECFLDALTLFKTSERSSMHLGYQLGRPQFLWAYLVASVFAIGLQKYRGWDLSQGGSAMITGAGCSEAGARACLIEMRRA